MNAQTHSETWIDYVQGIFPEATEEDVEYVLWECTEFPMCGNTHTKKQIQDMKDASDGTLKNAIENITKEG